MTAGAIAVPTIIPLRLPTPGQHKTAIDTNTKIELASETAGVTIYYTTNGAKPEPFGTHGPAAKSTYKYREPFRLAGGKKTVRAVAIAPDGIRESHIVTKAFEVEEVQLDGPPIREDGLDFVNEISRDTRAKRDVQRFAHNMVTSKQAWKEISKMNQTEQMMEDMTLMGSSKYHPMMNGNIPSSAFHMTNGHHTSPKRLPPDTATQAMRLQRETDFLKCVYCMAPRPSDPYARFCFDCGNPVPPLPQTRMPPPEPGQMGTCVECNSLVPFNAPTCVICEAPLQPQNQPQASVKLGEKLVCMVCGTANPGMLTSCVTCEARLPLVGKPVHLLNSSPPEPRAGSQMITCSKCGRINNGDARFCDWCGTKPSAPGSKLSCTRCQASNHPYAQYCGSCGTIIEPPQRPEVRNSGISVTLNHNALKSSGPATWMPVNLSGRPVPTQPVATQTVGLFYPSEREMKKRMAEEEEKMAMEKQMRDRKPLLTAISPGRGYWRKQMEHIVTHLKAHAQNNAEFRALIGEPRMGKIISTVVHEDAYELSMTVNYALRGNKDPFDGDSQPGTATREYLSSYTRGRHSSMDRYGSMDSLSSMGSARKTKKKPVKKKPKKPVRKEEDKLSPEDKQLFKELGKNGEGMRSEVQQLLDEGADPNTVDKSGYTALHLAVLNKHVDAIPILVQDGGADIDKKGPTRGNTALHEAVNMGDTELIDVLLGCKANTQKKNEKGETPYDLAVKLGYESVGRKLAASLGQTALGRLVKPKSQPEFDE